MREQRLSCKYSQFILNLLNLKVKLKINGLKEKAQTISEKPSTLRRLFFTDLFTPQRIRQLTIPRAVQWVRTRHSLKVHGPWQSYLPLILFLLTIKLKVQ